MASVTPSRPFVVRFALFIAMTCGAVFANHAHAQTWFALLGDPQVGYGFDGRTGDAIRFARVLSEVAERGAAFVVIPGDLVQDRSYFEWRAFILALETTRLPVHLTAGNHDVVDRDSLDAFRTELGRDYYDVTHEGVTLIVVDSETARAPSLDPQEFQKQWAWLERTLRERHKGATERFLVTHRPPFVEARDEPESGGNWPPDTRERLLDLLERYDVHHVLVGHLHQTRRAHDPKSGVTIYSVGGSARVTDEHGAGYRAFRVEGGKVHQRYVGLFATPSAPADFLGVPGWTPRIFYFSLRHWLLTVLYGVAGMLSLVAAARFRAPGKSWLTDTGWVLWGVIGSALWFFGVNEQLDFDELLVGAARAAAHTHGWFDIRHRVGTTIAATALSAAGLTLVFVWWRAGRARRPAWLALLALLCPTAWFVLSTLSDHDFGMVLGADTWDVLLFASVALGIFAAVRGSRLARFSYPTSER